MMIYSSIIHSSAARVRIRKALTSVIAPKNAAATIANKIPLSAGIHGGGQHGGVSGGGGGGGCACAVLIITTSTRTTRMEILNDLFITMAY